MPDLRLLNQVQELTDRASESMDEYSGLLGPIRQYIIEHFGANGLVAVYVLLSVIVLVTIGKLAKVTFSTLKYVAIPAVVLAILATYFMNITFLGALPVSTTVCSLFLLFKA